jgi:hypothetical protein
MSSETRPAYRVVYGSALSFRARTRITEKQLRPIAYDIQANDSARRYETFIAEGWTCGFAWVQSLFAEVVCKVFVCFRRRLTV